MRVPLFFGFVAAVVNASACELRSERLDADFACLFGDDTVGPPETNLGGADNVTVQQSEGGLRFVAEKPFDDLFVEIPFVEPMPIPIGNVDIDVGSSRCTGEGCDTGLFVASQSGERFLELGRINFLEDQTLSATADDTRMSVVLGDPSLVCDQGVPLERAPAMLHIRTDDDVIGLAPGETLEVTIDGARWRAIAGRAGHVQSVQDDEPCADCSPPGVHTNTFASGALYRLNPL